MQPMRLNLFPVRVQAGDVVYEQVRVYATDTETTIWGLVAGTPTAVVTGAPLVRQMRAVNGETFADGTKVKWTLPLTDGTTWLVSPGQGCGCSHPLKRFDPANAVRS